MGYNGARDTSTNNYSGPGDIFNIYKLNTSAYFNDSTDNSEGVCIGDHSSVGVGVGIRITYSNKQPESCGGTGWPCWSCPLPSAAHPPTVLLRP